MKVTIAHLYYDLLNLYGENGNIRALTKYLENQNIEVELKKVTMFDNIEPSNYDFIYIGMGTEKNQLIALTHLIKYKKAIRDYIENGGFLLATGNSFELFGKYIINLKGKKTKALNIFSYNAKLNDNRIICESIMKADELDDEIIGLQNRGSITENIEKYWFNVIKTFKPENNAETKEGIHYKNFYGTYLLGPLLVRNPKILEEIGNELIKSKNENYDLKNVDFELENAAYMADKKRYELK